MELKILADEEAAYRKALEIRSQFCPELFEEASSGLPKDREDSFLYSGNIALQILSCLEHAGIPFNRADPGHGIGHWIRDLINAHLLLSALEFEPAHILAGMAGGALPDVVNLVNKYIFSRPWIGNLGEIVHFFHFEQQKHPEPLFGFYFQVLITILAVMFVRFKSA